MYIFVDERFLNVTVSQPSAEVRDQLQRVRQVVGSAGAFAAVTEEGAGTRDARVARAARRRGVVGLGEGWGGAGFVDFLGGGGLGSECANKPFLLATF